MNRISQTLLAGAMALLLIATAAADPIRLRVRESVVVRGQTPTAADLLMLDGAPTELLDAASAATIDMGAAAPATRVIDHEAIVQKLRDAGVNMAEVLLTGAASCRVTLEVAPEETSALPLSPLASKAGSTGEETTLAAVLRKRVIESTRSLGGDIEVEFERSAGDALALTSPPFEFAIRGGEEAKLGLREFSVAVRRDGKTQRTLRIAARVKMIKRVLVAHRALNQGTQLREEALEFAPRLFSDDGPLGIEHLELVVGQRVKRFIPAGEMIQTGDLEAMDMVQRSRPVTITGGEHVAMRLTGVALENGRYGDTIRVRLGDSRKNQREARGVVTGFASVRLVEDTP